MSKRKGHRSLVETGLALTGAVDAVVRVAG